MTHPFGITVTVLGETSRTVHGDRTQASVGVIERCAFAPGGSTEDNDQRAQVTATGTLYVPPSTVPITAQSRIQLPDGTVWLVDGVPQEWKNPFTGWYPGREIQLRRVTG